MADLVAQHARQLRLRVEGGEDAASHEDESAGQREGVHHDVVNDLEAPGQARLLRPGGQILADPAHVLLQLRIVIQAHVGFDLLGALAPHLDLLALADENQLPLARRRVDRTAGEGQRCQREGGYCSGEPHGQPSCHPIGLTS